MATTLSSTFDIIYDGPQLAVNDIATLSISAIGRSAFGVVGMSIEGVNLSVGTLTRSVTAGAVAIATATSATPVMAVIDPAEVVVPAGEDLILTCTGAVIDRFVITCSAEGTTITQVIT